MYLSVLISLKVFHCIGEYVCGQQHILKTLVNWGRGLHTLGVGAYCEMERCHWLRCHQGCRKI